MIGVFVRPVEKRAAAEFFELCKTPWEFGQPGRNYRIVIAIESETPVAALTIRFNPNPGPKPAPVSDGTAPSFLRWSGDRIPIYCGLKLPSPGGFSPASCEKTGGAAISTARHSGGLVVEIGYNLFSEVAFLLTAGQPAAQASIPTLDLHMSLLRDIVTRAGQPFVEIPPVPSGHSFIGCLSHDIDHPLLRNHCFDHTMLGFVLRATGGSVKDALRKKRPAKNIFTNWLAAAKLPFVYLKLAEDCWSRFEKFSELENNFDSTFFAIPRKAHPGKSVSGTAPVARGCGYHLREIAPQLQAAAAAGNEIGLHGIDAWSDAQCAREEAAIIKNTLGIEPRGLRMHWLYFAQDSFRQLDQAGFSYDSTFGYNQTVGYRAGTTQAFRPLDAETMLELPLHLMDTSLFYPAYLDLSEAGAQNSIKNLIANNHRFGGTLTINWHDRSIFPERLWDDCYRFIIQELEAARAWCPTMSQACSWFNLRRSTKIEISPNQELSLLTDAASSAEHLPGLILRIHRPHPNAHSGSLSDGRNPGFIDHEAGEFTSKRTIESLAGTTP